MRPFFIIANLLLSIGVHAKSLYVAANGSDATAYADNDAAHPWASVDKPFHAAQAGDSVFFAAGSYNITATIDNRLSGNDGTATNPITVMPAPGADTVTWTAVPNSLYPVIEMERKHWHIQGIKCVGGFDFFRVGWNSSTSRSGFRLDGMTWICNFAGDNQAFVYGTPLMDSSIFTNNRLIGPGTTLSDDRTSGFLFFQTKVFRIRNNIITGMKIAIFHKHGNTEANNAARANTDIRIEGNFVSAYSTVGINLSSRWAVVRNNIVGPGNDPGSDALRIGEDGGFVGGDSNLVEHNTFINFVSLWYDTRSGDQIPGAIGNVLRNNLFRDRVELHRYSPVPHATVTDYNLYPDLAQLIWNNGITYSLAEYKTASGQDANSIAGTPVFTDAPGASIAEYRLASTSLGYHSASDGTDKVAKSPHGESIRGRLFFPVPGQADQVDGLGVRSRDRSLSKAEGL